MVAGLFGSCLCGFGVIALLIGLGFNKTQIAKAGLGLLLGVITLYGAMLAWAGITHAQSLENHPLPGTWLCISANCPPEFTFDDTTWQTDNELTILHQSTTRRDGVILSGTETCDLTKVSDTQFSIDCGGNTTAFKYQINGDQLTLNFHDEIVVYKRVKR